jgi:hypothetical protein
MGRFETVAKFREEEHRDRRGELLGMVSIALCSCPSNMRNVECGNVWRRLSIDRMSSGDVVLLPAINRVGIAIVRARTGSN